MKVKIFVLFTYIVALIIGFLSFTFFSEHFNLLISTLLADILCTIIIFVFSMLVDNSSMYDPYWSVLPPLIVLLWLWKFEVFNIYTSIILAVYLIWSIRLTLNWFINWKGYEDWRYVGFRKKFGKLYPLISFLGIHLFPTLIVFLSLLPLYFGFKLINIENFSLFYIGNIICLLGVFISLIADIQLTKHRTSINKDLAINIGIWKYSRHPNYLGELSFWLGTFIIGLSYSIDNYFTSIGIIGMILLFNLYSIPAMEKKLLQSKTNYQEIINETPRLLPIKIFKSNKNN